MSTSNVQHGVQGTPRALYFGTTVVFGSSNNSGLMNDHPVWHVYDELCTARLNSKYYDCLLSRRRRWQVIREFLMAASGSTGVAGIWLLSTEYGTIASKALASVSALLAVYQGVTRPSEAIRKLERQVIGWGQLEYSLADVRRRIHEAGRYDEGLQREVKAILDHEKKGMLLEVTETQGNEKLLRRCFEQVKAELPADRFFVPAT